MFEGIGGSGVGGLGFWWEEVDGVEAQDEAAGSCLLLKSRPS